MTFWVMALVLSLAGAIATGWFASDVIDFFYFLFGKEVS